MKEMAFYKNPFLPTPPSPFHLPNLATLETPLGGFSVN